MQGRDDAPGDDDAADPDARSDLVQHDVAGDFEGEVAEEEDAGANSIDAVAELEITQHLKFGEAYVNAVDVGNDVADHEDRHDAPCDLAVKRVADTIGGGFRRDIGCG